MHLPSLLLSLLPLTTALFPTRQIYQFPNGTWVENLAVRATGELIVSLLTGPEIYLINPLANPPTANLLHNFTTAQWALGITETSPDTFYVVVANDTLPEVHAPAPGSNRIYKVWFPSAEAQTADVSLVATVADAVLLNGLITLNDETVLAADSSKGVVWAINVVTGTSRIVIEDPLMAGGDLGINGLRLFRDHTLFFTNTEKNILARIDISPQDGTPIGPNATVVATAPPGAEFDDFALDVFGNAFLVTGSANSVLEVKRDGEQVVVAGNLNSTDIAEPTSAQFGRGKGEWGVLYVTTGGGLEVPVDGTEIVGGQVVAVDTRRFW